LKNLIIHVREVGTNNKNWKNDFFSNTLVIAVTELIMMLGGLQLITCVYLPIYYAIATTNELQDEFVSYGTFYVTFLIPIIICLR